MDKKSGLIIEIGKLLDICRDCKKVRSSEEKDKYGWYKKCEMCPIKPEILQKGKELNKIKKVRNSTYGYDSEENTKTISYEIKNVEHHGRGKHSKFKMEIEIEGKLYKFDDFDKEKIINFIAKYNDKISRDDLIKMFGKKRYYKLRKELQSRGILIGSELRKKQIKDYIKANFYKENGITIMNNIKIGHRTYRKVINELKEEGFFE